MNKNNPPQLFNNSELQMAKLLSEEEEKQFQEALSSINTDNNSENSITIEIPSIINSPNINHHKHYNSINSSSEFNNISSKISTSTFNSTLTTHPLLSSRKVLILIISFLLPLDPNSFNHFEKNIILNDNRTMISNHEVNNLKYSIYKKINNFNYFNLFKFIKENNYFEIELVCKEFYFTILQNFDNYLFKLILEKRFNKYFKIDNFNYHSNFKSLYANIIHEWKKKRNQFFTKIFVNNKSINNNTDKNTNNEMLNKSMNLLDDNHNNKENKEALKIEIDPLKKRKKHYRSMSLDNPFGNIEDENKLKNRSSFDIPVGVHHSTIFNDDLKFVDNYKKIKTLVMGSNKVGKSTFVMKFLHRNYSEFFEPNYEKDLIKVGTNTYEIDLIDDAGQEGINSLFLKYNILHFDVFLLMFNLQRFEKTFKHVTELIELILEKKNFVDLSQVAICLCANDFSPIGEEEEKKSSISPMKRIFSSSSTNLQKLVYSKEKLDENTKQIYLDKINRYLSEQFNGSIYTPKCFILDCLQFNNSCTEKFKEFEQEVIDVFDKSHRMTNFIDAVNWEEFVRRVIVEMEKNRQKNKCLIQ
ncbi:hypothetical protein ABK040_004118 [Willaertia magna]